MGNLIPNFLTLLLDFYSPYAIINNEMRDLPKINQKNMQGKDRIVCLKNV